MRQKCKHTASTMDKEHLPSIFTTMRVVPSNVALTRSPPLLDLPLPDRLLARYKSLKQEASSQNSIQDEIFSSAEWQTLLARIPLLERHLERLVRSAKALSEIHPGVWDHLERISEHGSPWISPDTLSKRWILANLLELAPQDEEGKTYRLRMELSPTHALPQITFTQIDSTNKSGLKVRLDSCATTTESAGVDEQLSSFVYLHKSSTRAHYTDAQARVGATMGAPKRTDKDPGGNSARQDCFDVLMWTEDSESGARLLTESGIANIIVEDTETGTWMTPSLSQAGPLPGLMREELLQAGALEERDILVDILIGGDSAKIKLYLCNALRGVFPVELEP
jgi:branched-subunit amino acid aminotransferase/4-amino-4-deoxychorismate lyase